MFWTGVEDIYHSGLSFNDCGCYKSEGGFRLQWGKEKRCSATDFSSAWLK